MKQARDSSEELCECGGPRLEPERSVPVAGFSRELRLTSDAERLRFFFRLRVEAPYPVHVVYSPSAKRAEVKAADLKAYRIEGVSSACEAKRRWIAWWRGGAAAPRFFAPRRAGRVPEPVSGLRSQVPGRI